MRQIVLIWRHVVPFIFFTVASLWVHLIIVHQPSNTREASKHVATRRLNKYQSTVNWCFNLIILLISFFTFLVKRGRPEGSIWLVRIME